MIEFHIIVLLMILHYIGDFILQTDKMAINKSSSNKWLTYHVLAYSLVFVVISPLYALVNGVLHWITDFITSRIASHFYKNEKRGLFFKTIGFDQLIHMVTLTLTYWLMFT